MSGAIRQKIGLTKSRLKQYVADPVISDDLKEKLNEDLPLEEQKQNYYEARFLLQNHIIKLQQTIDIAETCISEWTALLTTYDGAELVKEQTLYQNVIEGPEGLQKTVLEGQEKVHDCKTIMAEIDLKLHHILTPPAQSPNQSKEQPTAIKQVAVPENTGQIQEQSQNVTTCIQQLPGQGTDNITSIFQLSNMLNSTSLDSSFPVTQPHHGTVVTSTLQNPIPMSGMQMQVRPTQYQMLPMQQPLYSPYYQQVPNLHSQRPNILPNTTQMSSIGLMPQLPNFANLHNYQIAPPAAVTSYPSFQSYVPPQTVIPPLNNAQMQSNFIPTLPNYTTPPVQQTTPAIPVKLEKLSLMSFDGNPTKWPEFWDVFEIVHIQAIPPVQKFRHLKSCLPANSPGYNAIRGLPVTNENYGIAINILLRRFGDPNVIKNELYKDLRKVSLKMDTITELRRSIDYIDGVIRQLIALGENVDHPSIVQSILVKLPSETINEIEKMKSPQMFWTLPMLQQCLQNYIAIKEQVHSYTGGKPKLNILEHSSFSPRKNEMQIAPKSKSSSMQNYAANVKYGPLKLKSKENTASKQNVLEGNKFKYSCAFCNGANHRSFQCEMYNSIKARQRKIHELNLCLRCLRTGHMIQKCPRTKQICIICNEKYHNRALCPQLFNHLQNIKVSMVQDTEYDSEYSETFSEDTEEELEQELDEGSQLDYEHTETENTQQSNVDESGNANANNVTSLSILSQNSTLMSANVQIKNKSTSCVSNVTVFFDSGSQRSFVTKKIASKLGLINEGYESLVIHTFLHKKPHVKNSNLVTFTLCLPNGKELDITANAIQGPLTNPIEQHCLNQEDILAEENLFDENTITYSKKTTPDVLIGLDYFWDIIYGKTDISLPYGLHVIDSKVGLLLTGTVPSDKTTTSHNYELIARTQMSQGISCLNIYSPTDTPFSPINLEDFWILEAIGIKDSPIQNDDDVALELFNKSIYFENGRYNVRWPWKKGMELPDNYQLAFGRFKNLLKRFQNDPQLLKKYAVIIEEQLKKGIIEKVDIREKSGYRVHYLAHHPVITPHKDTTKVRVVYDASARSNVSSNSLNDCLFRGPVMIPDLCGLLLRFRTYPIGIIADIEKAFLQINIQPIDRDVTRFIWLNDSANPKIENNLQIYRFKRVAFGVISSPFLLESTVKYHLNLTNTENSLKVAKNIYVDNIITGVETTKEAENLYVEIKSCFNKASMNMREWTTNDFKFSNFLPSEDKVNKQCVKVLGIIWDTHTDTFQYQIDGIKNLCLTKRDIMKSIPTIFDPHGLLSPVLLPGKLLLQNLWKIGYKWDDVISEDLQVQWTEIANSMKSIPGISIQRYFGTKTGDNVELHVFTDASKNAYSSAAYIKIMSKTNGTQKVIPQLLFAKSRMVPVNKEISLPRLELMAMLIGTRIISFIKKEMSLNFTEIHLWTDSSICLQWLHCKKPLPVFVENRLREIRTHTDVTFHYVYTKENPADLASRGCLAENIVNNYLWWSGPSWLETTSDMWPKSHIEPIELPLLIDIAKEHNQLKSSDNARRNNECQSGVDECQSSEIYIGMTNLKIQNMQKLDLNEIIPTKNYSTLNRLLHVTVYVLKFVKNMLSKLMKNQNKITKEQINKISSGKIILAKDISIARWIWYFSVQWKYYPELMLQQVPQKHVQLQKQLGLTLNNDYLLHCHGRLKNTTLPQDTIYPILLPKEDYFTVLIIDKIHKDFFHTGVQGTLTELRKSIWIPKGRQAVQSVLNKCFACKKHSGGPYKLPLMPPLPSDRTKQTKVFEYTGIDFMGPFWIKLNDEKTKIWVALFSCLTTRLIHLEPVFDLSGKTFLNSLRRFIANKGKPSKIYSDNASTFKLVNDTQKLIWNDVINNPELQNFCGNKEIVWSFITPYSPWQGGYYERMVGIVKNSFKKAVGKKILNHDEFCTCIAEIASIVNSRPLTYNYSDINSLEVLRPIDFIIPEANVSLPFFDLDINDPEYKQGRNSKDQLLEYMKHTQQTREKFWDLWHNEYLTSLRERYQIEHKQPHHLSHLLPKKGAVVLIEEENTPKTQWKLGIIEQLNPENNPRKATLLLPNKKKIERPINLLYPLEVTAETPVEQLCPTDKKDDGNQHNMRRPVTRSMTQKSKNINFMMTAVLLCLASFSYASNENQCSKYESKNYSKFDVVTAQTCTSFGYVIKKVSNDKFCWQQTICTDDKHLSKNGTCEQKCSCPKWADDCVHNVSPPQISPQKLSEILENERPTVCSFRPNSECLNKSVVESFAQIQLFNGSKYFVKQLNIKYSDSEPTQYDCIGSGSITGTPEFCTIHECVSSGTKFCFYQQAQLAFFVGEDGMIPVYAWGSILVKYYPEKTSSNFVNNCKYCKIICIRGGIFLQLEKNIGRVEICTDPYCYMIGHPQVNQSFMFPPEINLNEHSVEVKIFTQGYLIRTLGIDCHGMPYCETIDCIICLARIQHMECTPIYFMIYLFIFLLFAIYFGPFCFYYILKILLLLKSFIQCFLNLITWILKKSVLFCYYKYKHSKNGNTNTDQQSEKMNIKKKAYKPLFRKTPKATTLAILMLLGELMPPTLSCSETTTIVAKTNSCLPFSTGINSTILHNCQIDETTQLSLVPKGQDICAFFSKPDSNMPLGTLKIKINNILSICTKTNEYYTRDFNMAVQSSHRCNWKGSCKGQKCSAIKEDSKIKELKGEANNFPGTTHCASSCGCVTCGEPPGCWSCASSCLFYRTYAKPTSDTKTYEVFSCPSWKFEVDVSIKLQLPNAKDSVHKMKLSPGIKRKWKQFELTLSGITAPPVPLLNTKFITDEERTSITEASDSQQPVPGKIGALQCSNKEKASSFDCFLAPNICTCQPQEDKVSCSCSKTNIHFYFESSEKTLPLQLQGLLLENNEGKVTAVYSSIASLQIQLSMKKLILSYITDQATCEISVHKFQGCFSCTSGAKISFTCTTDIGSVLAHITCGEALFSTLCNEKGVTNTETLSFSKADINVLCEIKCPAKVTKFLLNGTLAFISRYEIGGIQHVSADGSNSHGGKFDLGLDIMHIFNEIIKNWYLILLVIISIFLVIICAPAICSLIISMCGKMVEKCRENILELLLKLKKKVKRN